MSTGRCHRKLTYEHINAFMRICVNAPTHEVVIARTCHGDHREHDPLFRDEVPGATFHWRTLPVLRCPALALTEFRYSGSTLIEPARAAGSVSGKA